MMATDLGAALRHLHAEALDDGVNYLLLAHAGVRRPPEGKDLPQYHAVAPHI